MIGNESRAAAEAAALDYEVELRSRAGTLNEAACRRVVEDLLVASRVGELDTPGAVLSAGRGLLQDERGAVADLDAGHEVATRVGDADRATDSTLGQRERALTVDVVRRDLLANGGDVSLGRGVTGLLALVQEHRDGDRSENADDDHDDEKLDQGEALVLLVHRLTDTSEHCSPSGMMGGAVAHIPLTWSLRTLAEAAGLTRGRPSSPLALRPRLTTGVPLLCLAVPLIRR